MNDFAKYTRVQAKDISAVQHRFFSRYAARKHLAMLTPAQRSRFVQAAITAPHGVFLHDPIEGDPVMGPLIERVREEAAAQVKQERGGQLGLGSCHAVWERTRVLLSERHGIEWMSPSAMEPSVEFD